MSRNPRTGRLTGALLTLLLAVSLSVPAFAAGPPRTLPRDPAHPPLKLAILLFPGVQVIDFTGPYEVFTQAFRGQGAVFDVYTVGITADTLRTSPPWSGLKIQPDYSILNAPRPDILVLPGGEVNAHFDKPEVKSWIKSCADSADYVMSVCNGAYFLAKTGLLDGLKATSTSGLIDGLKEFAPTVQLVYDERFVDNGKIITTAGLSSGIDGALHVVERIGGHELAADVARGMEYDWRPDSGYARAALADRWLRKMLGRTGFEFGDKVSDWHTIRQDGDRQTWTKSWEFDSKSGADLLLADVDKKLAESWQKKDSKAAGGEGASHWTFTDSQGGRWKAEARMTKAADAADRYRFFVRIDRIANG